MQEAPQSRYSAYLTTTPSKAQSSKPEPTTPPPQSTTPPPQSTAPTLKDSRQYQPIPTQKLLAESPATNATGVNSSQAASQINQSVTLSPTFLSSLIDNSTGSLSNNSTNSATGDASASYPHNSTDSSTDSLLGNATPSSSNSSTVVAPDTVNNSNPFPYKINKNDVSLETDNNETNLKTGVPFLEDDDDDKDNDSDDNSAENADKRSKRSDIEPALTFDIDGFDDIEIRPGVTFGLLWKLPSDQGKCLGNPLCIWMSKHFKDFNVVILGYVDPDFNLELSAEIQLNVKITNSLTFNYFKLILVASVTDPRIELQSKMTYVNPEIAAKPLEFTGSLMSDGKSLQLCFTMDGFIIPPKWPYFSIGDISLAIGYSPGPIPLPKLGFGMTLLLGKLNVNSDNSNAVKFEGRFEVDPNNPLENWIFVKVNKLTIDAFCKAYQLNCQSIPLRIRQSGFPKGLELSYSSKERYIAVAKRNIPMGLQICGTINILGASCYGNIIIQKASDSINFEVKLILPVLNWADSKITISRDSSLQQGPRGRLKLAGTKFDLEIEGYAKVLNIYAAVKIFVNNDNIEFQIEGPLAGGLMQAKLNLKARFESLTNFDISFTAEVNTVDFTDKLKAYMVKLITAAGAVAKKIMAEVQTKLNNARNALAGARAEVQRWKAKIDGWKREIAAKRDEYARKIGSSNSVDCGRECPDVCVPGPGWNGCCTRVWGACIGCPTWESCKFRAPNLICLAACKLKKLASSVMAWFQQKFEEAKMALLTIGSAGFIQVADGVVDLANAVVNLAQNAVNLANEKLSVAIKAAQNMISNLANLLVIEKFLVEGTFDSNYCGTVKFAINVVIFGKPVGASGTISLNDVLQSLYNILTGKSESGLKGISETGKEAKKVSGMSKTIDDSAGDFQAKRASANSEMKKKQTAADKVKESRRRDTILFPNRKSYIKTLFKQYSNHQFEDGITSSKAFEDGVSTFFDRPASTTKYNDIKSHIDPLFSKAPWKIIDDHDSVREGIGKIQNARKWWKRGKIIRKRTLGFESVKSPCQQLKKALKLYKDVADALISSSNRISKGYRMLDSTTALHKGELKKLKRDLIEYAEKYNMSKEDADTAYYFYGKLDDGYRELSKKSRMVLQRSDSYALPLLRKQIGDAVKRETGKSFLKFAEIINENAVKGYKRSVIPSVAYARGLKLLGRIKALVLIMSNEDRPLTSFTEFLRTSRNDIESMSRYTKRCRS